MMENKPKFCSECGARLTGSATFCSACGAKQEMAAAPVAETVPVTAPIMESAPAAEPVVVPVVAPVVEAVPVPADAPDTSLAAPRKARLSVFGLILVLAAVFFTFTTEMLQLYQWGTQAAFGKFTFGAMWNYLRVPNYSLSLLTAWVLPLVAFVFVLTKKKPAALIGLVLCALTLCLQVLFAAFYQKFMLGYGLNFPLPRLWMFGYRLINGESLFMTLRQFRGNHMLFTLYGFRAMFLVLGYYLKNFLALLACLMVAVKKAK